MLSFTAGNDNEMVWLFDIEYGTDKLRFSTHTENIVRSGLTYYPDILLRQTLSQTSFQGFERHTDLDSGGSIGEAAAFPISLSGEHYFSGYKYIHAFYPTSGKPMLKGSEVNVGICWTSRPSDAPVWLFKGFVFDATFHDAQIDSTIYDYFEIFNRDLPQIRISDPVLALPIAPYSGSTVEIVEDNKDEYAPIVYGSFPITTIDHTVGSYTMHKPNIADTPLVPMVTARQTTETNTAEGKFWFLIASHKLKTIYYTPYLKGGRKVGRLQDRDNNTIPFFYKYCPELKAYAACYSMDTDGDIISGSNNTNAGAWIECYRDSVFGDIIFNTTKTGSNGTETKFDTYTLVDKPALQIINKVWYFTLQDSDKTVSMGTPDAETVGYFVLLLRSDTNIDNTIAYYFHNLTGPRVIELPYDITSPPFDHPVDASVIEWFYVDLWGGAVSWEDIMNKLYSLVAEDDLRVYSAYLYVREFVLRGVPDMVKGEAKVRGVRRNDGGRSPKGVAEVKARWQLPNPTIKDFDTDSNFAAVDGRMYDEWIGARATVGNLIERPSHILESLIRDELTTERARVSYVISSTTIQLTGLLKNTDDYYNGAHIMFCSSGDGDIAVGGEIAKINDYSGGSGVVVLDRSVSEVQAQPYPGSYAIIYNIKASDYIDTTTFDRVQFGSTFKFARSIYQREQANSLIDSILYDSCSFIGRTAGKLRYISISAGSLPSVGTLSTPLYINGVPQVNVSYTSLDEIYTEFEFKYAYDYAKGEYTKTIFVSRDRAEGYSTSVYSTLQTSCIDAIKNYKIQKRWEYNSDWIYDDNTAQIFFAKMVLLHTTERMKISYTGSAKDHIKYEQGDLVLFNIPSKIPASHNNTKKFIINGFKPYADGGPQQVLIQAIEALV